MSFEMTLYQLLANNIAQNEYAMKPTFMDDGYMSSIVCYEQFLKRTALLRDLSLEAINSFDGWLAEESGLCVAFQLQHVGNIRALGDYAIHQGLIARPPRVRKKRWTPKSDVIWTPVEVAVLIAVTLNERIGKLKLPNIDIESGLYFGSMVSAAYDGCLSLNDLMKIKWSDLQGRLTPGEGASVVVFSSKTNEGRNCVFSPETMLLIKKVMDQGEQDRRLIWPDCGSEILASRFKEFVKLAKVSKGSFKKIRSSAIANTVAGLKLATPKCSYMRINEKVRSSLVPDESIKVEHRPVNIEKADEGIKVTYRPMNLDDEAEYEAVAKFFSLCVIKLVDREIIPMNEDISAIENETEPYYDEMSCSYYNPDAPSMVAYHNNNIVGYAECFDEFGSLPQVFVHPKYRRMGIGTELIHKLNEGLDKGCNLHFEPDHTVEESYSRWAQQFLMAAGCKLANVDGNWELVLQDRPNKKRVA